VTNPKIVVDTLTTNPILSFDVHVRGGGGDLLRNDGGETENGGLDGIKGGLDGKGKRGLGGGKGGGTAGS